MGDVKGFKKYQRELPSKEALDSRLSHFNEFYNAADSELLNKQSARCMDCGVPFCHNGCPLGNLIPDFNDAVFKGKWKLAYELLSSTNNFPEFTGRICPAPCEASCVLNINSDPVTIEFIEQSIIERAFEEGWVQPKLNIQRNGKKVAVIGSGPAGMAASVQLNNLGYDVHLFEKSDQIGGLLRYGIPDFKLEKNIIDRRIAIMRAEGIVLNTSMNVGIDISVDALRENYDAVILAGGSSVARDLSIPGRNLKDVHFAMKFLEQNNRRVAGQSISSNEMIDVSDKHVIVIGGGDTGADCVGTSNRLNAKSVTQIEILAKPPNHRAADDLWPCWPMVIRTSSSHEEGCEREWAILTKRFIADEANRLSGLEVVNISWQIGEDGKSKMVEDPNSKKVIPCDVAFLSIGFKHPQKEGLLNQLGVDFDTRGNVLTENFKTSADNIYSAGDMRRGQSLVVWAIAEGRQAAEALHSDLITNENEQPVSPELSLIV